MVGLALLAPGASAQTCIAPPGTSGIDQYCESIPSAGGDRGPSDRNGSNRSVPPSTAKALRHSGAAGAAVLGLTARNSSSGANSSKPDGKGRGAVAGERASGSAKSPGNNVVSAVRNSVENGATVGAGLIWALIGLALGLGAAGWIGYRRRGTAS